MNWNQDSSGKSSQGRKKGTSGGAHPAGANRWASEFREFMDVSDVAPPKGLSENVLASIHADLDPSVWSVFMKLSGIHAAAGGLSLFACAQFGMGRTTALTHALMGFGDVACFGLCGALFLGATGLVAGLLLSSSELEAIRRLAYSPILALQMASLLIFIFFGAEFAFTIGIAWVLGGLVAGIILAEIGQGLKRLRLALNQ